MEIEHKYLVKDGSYRRMAVAEHTIMQGYLSRTPEATVRVRVRDDEGFLTVKGRNEGDTRIEYEYPIPLSDARAMLSLCRGNIIQKTRYIVPYGGYTWEVDAFHGLREGLVVAEIELVTSHHEYPLPPFAGREVTGEAAYYNSNL